MHRTTLRSNWLERRWAAPAYAGWVLIGLTLCFWLAAANTLAGWLYVMSGLLLALLGLAAWLPMRLLQGISLTRAPIPAGTVGAPLSIRLQASFPPTAGPVLLEYRDCLPDSFGPKHWQVFAGPAPQGHCQLIYNVIPQRRGLFHWHLIQLRTAAPLGLFSSQRDHAAPATVLVYPQAWPLTRCPLFETLVAQLQTSEKPSRLSPLGQGGITRSLRPYRRGDALRLIHWRSTAKLNELRTRELETSSGDCPVIIALDTGSMWEDPAFESAITTAASLLRYGQEQGVPTWLWTSGSGLLQTPTEILETLAQVSHGETHQASLPSTALIWLTQHATAHLPPGSRCLRWQRESPTGWPTESAADLWIDPALPLDQQLQASLSVPIP
ncbi:DUF58 domain-containing protein [Lyngbya confervoides]|uniref:DUF58 domain-containing protein n=1 Tax=Lyngbya confervoides BDU141951 TaxID=1574623 RepID=A0ABD4SYR1_9CYAN|nr:DUF58 domain-containing protein [Lyngbya confervoides]MCM1981549.1 DUF58 domain-containing protein [Lyngbya confervoides BDU141951]